MLDRAAAVLEARDKLSRQLPTFPEPKRGKAHWDFLLEEMEWMAKEFARERGWKMKQTKRCGVSRGAGPAGGGSGGGSGTGSGS